MPAMLGRPTDGHPDFFLGFFGGRLVFQQALVMLFQIIGQILHHEMSQELPS